jgi:hypothetical protein
LFDTETGELIQTIDFVASLPTSFDFPGMSDWPQESGEFLPVPTNRDGTTGISVGGQIDILQEPEPQPYRVAMIWGSLGGAGLDPLQSGQEFLTTRPSQQINSTEAWYNIQYTDYVAGSGTAPSDTPYYIAPSSADYLDSNTGRAVDLTDGNDATAFNAGYSDTIKPVNRNI